MMDLRFINPGDTLQQTVRAHCKTSIENLTKDFFVHILGWREPCPVPTYYSHPFKSALLHSL